MREALNPISQDTSVHCLIVLEHGHIREETLFYAYFMNHTFSFAIQHPLFNLLTS